LWHLSTTGDHAAEQGGWCKRLRFDDAVVSDISPIASDRMETKAKSRQEGKANDVADGTQSGD
jgi:hypothetical protein